MLGRITGRAKATPIREFLLWLVIIIPFMVGYMAGTIAKLARLVWAAVQEGFEAGSRL